MPSASIGLGLLLELLELAVVLDSSSGVWCQRINKASEVEHRHSCVVIPWLEGSTGRDWMGTSANRNRRISNVSAARIAHWVEENVLLAVRRGASLDRGAWLMGGSGGRGAWEPGCIPRERVLRANHQLGTLGAQEGDVKVVAGMRLRWQSSKSRDEAVFSELPNRWVSTHMVVRDQRVRPFDSDVGRFRDDGAPARHWGWRLCAWRGHACRVCLLVYRGQL